MYKFEWHYGIKDQKSYEQFCEDMLKEDNPYFKLPANYEQAATLIYKDDTSGIRCNNHFVHILLQALHQFL